jgi:CMP-N-acetylneuraminic acid synthetase
MESRLLDRLIVSTDHPEMCASPGSMEQRCRSYVRRNWRRTSPRSLSPNMPCVSSKRKATRCRLRSPCSPPLRSARRKTLMPASRKLETDLDIVFTGCEVHERPEWMYRRDESSEVRVVPFTGRLVRGDAGISQKLPKLYIPNGAVLGHAPRGRNGAGADYRPKGRDCRDEPGAVRGY